MEEILHQFIGSLPCCYLQGFIHPRWLFGIFSINCILRYFAIRPPRFTNFAQALLEAKASATEKLEPARIPKKVPPVMKLTYLTGPADTKFEVWGKG